MDLSQYPPGPIGTPDDPLADPYDDPSYSYNFKSLEYNRQENADSSGRVTGLYSYLDDIGEKHTVRYAAGAGTGFEVLNAVPDSPASVSYSSPLYKAPKGTRGRMAVQRGPDGQYKFILSGPDHRRSESSGPDGIVRGSYSYLDDKGIQRTVQYIAGAGIGYRVVQSTTGAGTHLAPRPALPEYGIRDFQSNDLADDDGYLHTAESGRFRPKDGGGGYGKDSVRDSFRSGVGRKPGMRPLEDRDRNEDQFYDSQKPRPNLDRDSFSRHGDQDFKSSDGKIRQPGVSSEKTVGDSRGTKEKGYDYEVDKKLGGGGGGSVIDRRLLDRKQYSENGGEKSRAGERGRRPVRPSSGLDRDGKPGLRSREEEFEGQQGRKSGVEGSVVGRGDTSKQSNDFGYKSDGVKKEPKFDRDHGSEGRGEGRGGSYQKTDETFSGRRRTFIGDKSTSSRKDFYDDYDTEFPLVTSDHRKLEIDREKDWSLRGRDSTIIKNVGKWYIGLPPGAAVRAHVQNIDLLPLNGRIPSPSEALRRDELGGN